MSQRHAEEGMQRMCDRGRLLELSNTLSAPQRLPLRPSIKKRDGKIRNGRIASAIALSGGCAIAFSGNRTLAQSNILPDNTLGAETSVVVPNFNDLPVEVIGGGAVRGQNLFHSFVEFNVSAGRGAYFFSPNSNILNILARVTGTNPSQILGTLGTFGNSQPNLFLINPNGIFFGQNASLNVGGSFFASTANSVVFDNGFEFSATNPQAPPLLTVNVPLGLQFGANPGSIVNQSIVGLAVQPGRTLGLVGGEVALEGGILVTSDGQIELGSVAGNSRVNLTPNSTGYTLGYEGVENFQDIRLTQKALVLADANVGGGSIQVQGRNVTLTDGSAIATFTSGADKAGNLIVNASESVQLIGTSAKRSSSLFANTSGTGEAGELRITTRQLLLKDGASIGASTSGAGNGGSVIIDASDSVQLIGTSADGQVLSGLTAITSGTGNAGNVTITTPTLLVRDGAAISTNSTSEAAGIGGNVTINASDSVKVIGTGTLAKGQVPSLLAAGTEGTGDGGELTINTRQLLISDGASISASSLDTTTLDAGKGGNVIVNASEGVQVIGRSADGKFDSNLLVQAQGTGDAGNLTITTGQLLMRDGARVSADTFGAGKGGILTVNASESVQVIGESADGKFGSNLAAQANPKSTGAAGDLSITTARLLISDGAFVSASTFGAGKGGILTVNASEEVQIIGTSADGQFPSRLSVRATAGSTAGNLTVETRQMSVRDGAEVTVSSRQGQAGNLTITADSLRLNQGKLTAVTGTSGAEGGANITLQGLDLLRMDNESLISANALEDANGGNITIDSTLIIATPPKGSEGSDIVANAVRGNGGSVRITTQGLFGIEFRPQLTPNNDITVSSQFGLTGVFEQNTPGVDPSRGLGDLPTDVVDGTRLIDNRCTPAGATQRSSFVITGRGGLPPSPTDPLEGESVITNWVTLDSQEENTNTVPIANPTRTMPKQLVEAQSWVFDAKGQVILTAQSPTVTPYQSWQTVPSCHDLKPSSS